MSAPYLTQALIVGAGGFIGSALRFVVSGWAQRLAATGGFPYGTMAVNVIGCLLIGFLGGIADNRGILEHSHRLFLIVGVLGGFTTYSAFAYETMVLMQDAQLAKAMANVVLKILLGIGAAFAGYFLARFV